MLYLIALFAGIATGAICTFILLSRRVADARAQMTRCEADKQQIRDAYTKVKEREVLLAQNAADLDARVKERETLLTQQAALLDARVISFDELGQENEILKRDLRNLAQQMRRLEIDRNNDRERQSDLDSRTSELGHRYLKENVKWIAGSLNPNNFVSCKQRLIDVIGRCRGIGYAVSAAQEQELVADLKAEFERVVRIAFEREEQARIKAQIREEQRLEREIQRELQRVDRERAAIQAALDKALSQAADEHSAEIESLRSRLAEAEQRAQRAMSQAQLTKSGHVYVISNIGSFGEGVFKIGMTRRLEPIDRIKELGDASVPFPFDVHMMISSNDAPALENSLHRVLHQRRLNKANPRKEFFRSEIEQICAIVKEHHGEVEYVADPEALEYRQSQSMSDEDVEYIESVYDALEDDGEVVAED